MVGIITVLILIVSGCNAIQCRNGWVHHDSSCYLVVNLAETWVIAESCHVIQDKSLQKLKVVSIYVIMILISLNNMQHKRFTKDHCRILGGMLAEINNATENAFLKSTLGGLQNKNADYWIGGTDIEVEGEWEWITNKQRFTYTDWAPAEPNNIVKDGMSEGCALMSSAQQFKWNDDNCATYKANFICEIEYVLLQS
ncbi:hypothetical protein KUTeg_015608 [Tegillarca granosa]|uniref:C-type lectin domain-containing protein n=1 Tax=Tegillarca granosa TaxID=220873 RepID=A0ABQ9EQL0_TEGGR|nr:hypothetical protein KUTeg_015608 [Tegillarca granosa]